MLKHRFRKRLDMEYQTESENSIELKQQYRQEICQRRHLLDKYSMLYKLITIHWRRTGTIYLLRYTTYDNRSCYFTSRYD